MNETYSCKYGHDKTSVKNILQRNRARWTLLFIFCWIRILLNRNVNSRWAACVIKPHPLTSQWWPHREENSSWVISSASAACSKENPFTKEQEASFPFYFTLLCTICYKQVFGFTSIDARGKHLCSAVLWVTYLLSHTLKKKSYQCKNLKGDTLTQIQFVL